MYTHLLVPMTLISVRYIIPDPVDVMLILKYFPRASVVKFMITTGVLRSPLSIALQNIVLSVFVERRSALWTERLRDGILP